ncbi:hypothetical protein QUF72_08515 [Desulfobacterales bacterium HSG2]|nr:hypothetical protein [Desulfobacterales bacterium HSG2]
MLLSEVRGRLQRELRDSGLFLSNVEEDHIEITESKHNAKLKRVVITDIPYDANYEIWRLHLEKHKNIEGFGNNIRTVEEALVFLKGKWLKVYFIELKSSISSPGVKGKKKQKHPNTLNYIKSQISSSISRFLILLTINNHQSPVYKGRYDNVKIKFYGVIFYNKDNTEQDEDTEIYRIFKMDRDNRKGKRIMSIKTILNDEERIAVKFFKNPNPSSDKISVKFKELS